ncbi:MAG: GNAT family N-acetyltransferase [Chitinophagaceae bacterium]|nr:MAG: GNAT family N-acetyltransferase [Chitinophagaceae bacterium]
MDPYIKRTDSDDPDFLSLVAELDAELAVRDGDDHVFYAQLNKTANLPTCVVIYKNNLPVGSGAFRALDDSSVEIKRMYVRPEARGSGLASAILQELETWAGDLGFSLLRLETGKRQPEAIALYKKSGFHIIPNFGNYWNVENSVCFEKQLPSGINPQ